MKYQLSVFLFGLILVFNSCRSIKEVEVVGIENVKLKQIDAKGIKADIFITIKNTNDFGFTMYPSQCNILLNNIQLGKAKLQKRVHIDAHCEKTYAFNLSSDDSNLNPINLLEIMTSQYAKLELDGYLKTGKLLIRKKFKINYTDKIELFK